MILVISTKDDRKGIVRYDSSEIHERSPRNWLLQQATKFDGFPISWKKSLQWNLGLLGLLGLESSTLEKPVWVGIVNTYRTIVLIGMFDII